MVADAPGASAAPAHPPIEVLVVSPPSALWGAQLRLLDYAPELASRGLRLTLGSPPEGDLYAAWVEAGLPHRSLQVPFVIGIRDPDSDKRPGIGTLAQTAVGVARGAVSVFTAAADYDAVWSFSLRTHLGVAAACRVRRTPVIIEVVDIVRPGIGRRLLQLAAVLADATIVNSEATAAPLEGRARKLRVIHPGVDVDRFRPGEPDAAVRAELAGPGGITVGIVGRIDPMKGIHVLVEAMAEVGSQHDVTLVVVGDVGVGPDTYASGVQARARALLGDRVRFAGRRADVAEVLRALDILVNASDAEPFGRSVLEAQASGVAVVVNDSGGTTEFVTHRQTGLVVEQDDPVALARAISELCADHELRRRLAEAGREQAVQRYDIRDRYSSVGQLVREVVAS